MTWRNNTPAALVVLVVGLLSLLLSGMDACGPPPGPDGGIPPESFACELGLPGHSRLEFVPLGETNEAELMLGFQGLSFAPFRARMEPDAPEDVDVLASLQVEGFEPIGMQQSPLGSFVMADGQRITRDLQLPVNRGAFSQYVGKRAEVAVRLFDDIQQPTRLCLATGTVILVDNDQCIHTGDVPVCPDGGPADGGDVDGGDVDGGDADGGDVDGGQAGDPTDAGVLVDGGAGG